MSAPNAFALREYALLADGERGALIDPHGNVAWLCAPRWHDAAIFSSLLGGQGRFAVTPTGRFVWGGHYESESLIWRSRWVTETGTVECREALALPTRPGRLVLLRRIEAIEGPAHLVVALNLRTDFDRRAIGLRRREDGTWRGGADDLHVAFSGAPGATHDVGLRVDIELEPGGRHDLVLVVGDQDTDVPDAEALWQATEAAWRERVPHLGHTLAPRDARHAVAVLHGLTSAGGGMVAAATMSLPERARHGRNYDYRYVWIRDQCYAGEAAAATGVWPLLDAALSFVRDRLLDDGPRLRPAYTVTGGPVPDEEHVGLPGYPGGGDVRGNRANAQFQLDTFGEALLLIAAGQRHDRLDPDHWRAAEVAAEAIESRWHEADSGVWELDPDCWAHSRLICVAGLRAAAAASPASATATRWSALADAILAECSGQALHPDGRWQRSPSDGGVDASLLLAALRGALPAEDPRSIATLDAVIADLGEDHYAYRFRPDGRPLGQAEGAFLLCGLWTALACAQSGRPLEAVRWFERGRTACGPPGLFAEEYDVTQRQLRGNLPQAFVHALLLESASALADAS
jgi:GH15 family glucan-1,4-alpha-glucosidase